MNDILPMCQVCGLRERQYKCPRCSTMSCSLACCKKHKADTGCSGRREASTFKNLNEMNANDLQRDYHFLENVLSRKDGAKRTLSQSCGGSYDTGSRGRGASRKRRHNSSLKRARVDTNAFAASDATPQNLEVHKPSVQRLVKASWDRKCYLSIMPPGMSRREINSSRYMPKSDTILWRLQIVFVAQEGAAKIPSDLLQRLETINEGELASSKGLVGISYEGIDEKTNISEILAPLIDQVSSGEGKYEAQRHALRYLRQHRNEVTCMFQRIPSSSSNPIFTDVDESLSLRDALAEKSVLEFPVLYVGLASDMAHLRRHIEEIPGDKETIESSGEGAEDANVNEDENEDEDEDEDEDEEEEEEEEDGKGFMEALQEMGTKPIQDLQRIIEEST